MGLDELDSFSVVLQTPLLSFWPSFHQAQGFVKSFLISWSLGFVWFLKSKEVETA